MISIVDMITDLPLSQYRATLTAYRESESEIIFDNDTFEHAKILITELALSTKTEGYIQINTAVFCDSIFNDKGVKAAFKEAAERKAFLDIIASGPLTGIAFLEYKAMFADRFNHLDTTTLYDDNDQVLNNFMVVDSKALRYEQQPHNNYETIDCHTMNRPDMNAVASFNDPLNAESLSYYFESKLPKNSLVLNN